MQTAQKGESYSISSHSGIQDKKEVQEVAQGTALRAG